MKIKKIGAVAAAALVMASLAVSASASNLPADSNAVQKAAAYYVVDAGVDASGIDWANVQEGELVAIGTIPRFRDGRFTPTFLLSMQPGISGIDTNDAFFSTL